MNRSMPVRPGLLLVRVLILGVLMTTHSVRADDGPADSAPSARGFLEALAAPGPSPSLGDAASAYSWLVGSWDAEVIDYPADGPPRRNRGEWHFAWILEGRAFGDVWIVPPRSGRSPGDLPRPGNRYGVSVRVYDPGIDAWRLTWLNPVTGAEDRLIGRMVDGEVVHTGTDRDGVSIRWRFTDVRPDSFVWLGESSRDGGETWRLEAEFRARRRSGTPSVPPDAPERPWTVRWEWTDRPGLESLVVSRRPDGVVAEGEVLVVYEGVPTRIGYRFAYDDDWRFLNGRVGATAGEANRELEIVRGKGEEWRVNGAPRPDLDGCSDLDLMATPFTNTPPLQRFALAPGEAEALRVAWIRLPDLSVEPVRQEYRRLDDGGLPSRFLYRNLETGFEGELTVDARLLVLSYGPWRALGRDR